MTKRSGRLSKKNQIEDIFQKVTKDDLKKFIEIIFDDDLRIKNRFIYFFAEFLDEGLESKYRNLVRHIIKSYEDRYGFIDYRASFPLSRELSNLLQKAYGNIEINLNESLGICKAIIEEIPLLVNHMDDSSGSLISLSGNSFDIFAMIAEKSPPQLKDQLFDYCIKEMGKEKYHEFDFIEGFFFVIPKLITLEEQEKKFLHKIDELIKIEDNSDVHVYRTTWLIKEKIKFLKEQNRNEEAGEIIEENLDRFEIRELLFEEEISNKNYDKAIEIGLDGITIAQKGSAPGHEIHWKEKLLSVYEIVKDTDKMREYAIMLFTNNLHNITYYRKLKSTYNPKEWVKICEDVIDQIKGSVEKGIYSQDYILANLYIEENYKSRLFKLLEKNSNDIYFIEKFSPLLMDDYSEQISSFYVNSIKKNKKKVGRSAYREVVGYLKKLRNIDGGKEKVITLLKYFKEQYKNRPAMMEILMKNFEDMY